MNLSIANKHKGHKITHPHPYYARFAENTVPSISPRGQMKSRLFLVGVDQRNKKVKWFIFKRFRMTFDASIVTFIEIGCPIHFSLR